MTWRAIVPIKGSGERKTRLSSILDATQRRQLSDRMLAHVLGTLSGCAAITQVIVLSDIRPDRWEGSFHIDGQRGLNQELQALVEALEQMPTLVIHADLPLLASDDIDALLAAARREGGAIAPDRHDEGTNAIALPDATDFAFGFGTGSFARHRAMREGSLAVERRPGLSVDIDTPDDLDLLIRSGPDAARFTV